MLLSNVFDSIKEINSLRKKDRLLSKGMSNICLKVAVKTSSKLQLSGLKKICHQFSFGELQLALISLNFKTSSCNLKIRRLGAKQCLAFLLF